MENIIEESRTIDKITSLQIVRDEDTDNINVIIKGGYEGNRYTHFYLKNLKDVTLDFNRMREWASLDFSAYGVHKQTYLNLRDMNSEQTKCDYNHEKKKLKCTD